MLYVLMCPPCWPCTGCNQWGDSHAIGSRFFVLSWSGFVFQLAGMKSRVPWPTRDCNGGGQKGVLRRLRGLLVLVACYQSVASASACAGPTHCFVIVLGSSLPAGHSKCMGIHAHLAVTSKVLRPLPQGRLGWAVGVHSPSSRLPSSSSPMNTMYQHHVPIGVIRIYHV